MKLDFNFLVTKPLCSVKITSNTIAQKLYSIDKNNILSINGKVVHLDIQGEIKEKSIIRLFFTNFLYQDFRFPLYDLYFRQGKLSKMNLFSKKPICHISDVSNLGRKDTIESYIKDGFSLGSNKIPLNKRRYEFFDSDDVLYNGLNPNFFEENQKNSVNFIIKRPNIVLDFDSRRLSKKELLDKIISKLPSLLETPFVETKYGYHFHILCNDCPPFTQMNLAFDRRINLDVFLGGIITVPPSHILDIKGKLDVFKYQWINTGEIKEFSWAELTNKLFNQSRIKLVLKEFELTEESRKIYFINSLH